MTSILSRRIVLLGSTGIMLLGGCSDDRQNSSTQGAESSLAANATVPPVAEEGAVFVSPENIVIVTVEDIEDGPSISGSLTPESESVIRAEAGGSVLEVFAEQGQAVTRGQLLARIEDTTLLDQLQSARAAQRSAEQAAQVARRNLERANRLVQAGAIAERDVEAARIALANADAQVADAAARVALAGKQVAKTQILSPIDGVISLRPVNGGDIVSPGSALFSIVDPRRMQLIASVPAASIATILPGAPVRFRVQGYADRAFEGIVSRISPAADPATRQLLVYVKVSNVAGKLVSGLYAEGMIGTKTKTGLSAPLTVVDYSTATPAVIRLRNGRAERVPVQVGLRDERNERVELIGDVAAGDTLLVGTAHGITPGTTVRVVQGDAAVRR